MLIFLSGMFFALAMCESIYSHDTQNAILHVLCAIWYILFKMVKIEEK